MMPVNERWERERESMARIANNTGSGNTDQTYTSGTMAASAP